ncbi:hypothetical protein [Methylobacterium sp. WCS2018Hpa-22]|uniref:hypothetical protein n=1 Tax=Methylobacterium sp. WCS2018Hpa-22 TaxID=3073633 RepID=UPI00288A14F6|nr:hypothetical protein [Methylobacterium sp. WCS2018Hpa-22]
MPVSLFDARAGQCRYPVSGEGLSLIVCGDPVAPGKSYCPACCRVVFVRASTPRSAKCAYTVKRSAPAERERDLVEVYA